MLENYALLKEVEFFDIISSKLANVPKFVYRMTEYLLVLTQNVSSIKIC